MASSNEPISVPIPIKDIGCQDLLRYDNVLRHGTVRLRNTLNKLIDSSWLPRHAALQIKWPRAYVVLHSGCFYAFHSETSKAASKASSLFGYSAPAVSRDELAIPLGSKLYWIFKISRELDRDEKKFYYFAAPSKNEMESWIGHLKKEIAFANDGVRLSLSLLRSNIPLEQTIKPDRQLTREEINSWAFDKSEEHEEEQGSASDSEYDTVDNNATDDVNEEDIRTSIGASFQNEAPQFPSSRPPARLPNSSNSLPASAQRPPVNVRGMGRHPSLDNRTNNGTTAVPVPGPNVRAMPRPVPPPSPPPVPPVSTSKPVVKAKPPTTLRPQPGPENLFKELKTAVTEKKTSPTRTEFVVVADVDDVDDDDDDDDEAEYCTPVEDFSGDNDQDHGKSVKHRKANAFEKAFWSKSATEAEQLLITLRQEGTYLVRNSKEDPYTQALLVQAGDIVRKFRINKDEFERVALVSTGPWFPSGSKLLLYYTENPLPKMTNKLVKPWSELDINVR